LLEASNRSEEMKFTAFCLTALSVVITNSIASPNGAPQRDDVCSDMTPRHEGAVTQALPAPFELVLTENNIKGGKKLKITIRRTGSDTFKGFLLQARTHNATDESNFEIVGEFFAAQNDQSEITFRNCASRSHNCVTHANNNYKESVAFEWKAPYDFEGRVYFM
jgi:Reeler domain